MAGWFGVLCDYPPLQAGFDVSLELVIVRWKNLSGRGFRCILFVTDRPIDSS